MRDHITKLCEHPIGAEEPQEVLPRAAQLQEAVHDRVKRVRQDAMDVVMIDRVIDLEGIIESQSQNFSESPQQYTG